MPMKKNGKKCCIMHDLGNNVVQLLAEAIETFIYLTPAQRLRFARHYHRKPAFFWFALRASIIAFIFLIELPTEPMSMLIAFGGGLYLSLLIH